MLSRKHKVPRGVFPKVLRSGRTKHGTYVTLRVSSAASCKGQPAAVSFVVPKSVARTAVQRNRLKRRGYAAVLKILPRLAPCLSCVFFFKKGVPEPPYRALEGDLEALLKDAGGFLAEKRHAENI
ncbi:MAG: ribonuclease P protein component [Parcubacteria group bacterium]|nr:ribonuclease P protein component [Parcubacteria group bacterium]